MSFRPHFSFNIPDLNERQRQGFLKLFEAVWRNDIEKVKALTLGVWSSDADGANPPLEVAVQEICDSHIGFCPFSLAVLRGHYPLARLIVEIALAQYEPQEKSGRRKKWNINSYVDEYDSDYESDGPNIYSEIIDDTFTIENVSTLSTTVKSRVDPLTMIGWQCKTHWLQDDKDLKSDEQLISRLRDKCDSSDLLSYAVRVDDMKLVKFLLQTSAECRARVPRDENLIYPIVEVSHFNTAIKFGRTAILAELIKATGVGIPLDDLVQKSGIIVETSKSKYYQGLSIAGKKRTGASFDQNLLNFLSIKRIMANVSMLDWAQAGREQAHSARKWSDKKTPLLKAAYSGSIESAQWFLSDSPAHRYMEFAATNKSDRRVQTLEQSDDGFVKTITSWLNARSESVFV
jgi:hypothetical protein